MSFLNDLYYKSIAENKQNLKFWEDYLQNLKSLNFEVFSDKLKVPALIPIGSKILFKGELRHTNEVIVALGANYFTKCSLKQAEVLRQHRIKNAESKVNTYKKEKEYFENQLTFKKQHFNENEVRDIIEYYTEEEDRIWREKHTQNVRKYKQMKNTTLELSNKNTTDEELWYRLEQLELQEELENELEKINVEEKSSHKSNDNSFINREEENFIFSDKVKNTSLSKEPYVNEEELIMKREPFTNTNKALKQTSKQDLLQQVIDKQNELERKLLEMKNKERTQSKTEKDLISKLDEMDELDELEDEMDRLDDILQNENIEEVAETDVSTSSIPKLQKGVFFADEDDSETIELTFKHTDVEPCKNPYDPKMGIVKPSDIYAAFSDLFTETKSILKKIKYTNNAETREDNKLNLDQSTEIEKVPVVNKTIVIKDIINKEQHVRNKLESSARPTSLFKKKRLQNKRQTN